MHLQATRARRLSLVKASLAGYTHMQAIKLAKAAVLLLLHAMPI